jgi:DNA helicase-2/ATP-dependent DNA helicase PcrA
MSIEKHKVIYGPPGTGKTRTLIGEMTAHVQSNPTGQVLFCSHTKAAAQTALSRWGAQAPSNVDIQTLHSFCFREQRLSMSQTVDGAKLDYFLDQYGLDSEEGGEGRRYMEVASYSRSTGKSLEEAYQALGAPGNWGHFQSVMTSYANYKTAYGYIDFVDMLERYVQRARRRDGHTLLIVDEAQDLTPLHWRVIEKFMELSPSCQVVVAGDDDQAIFGYTGADPLGQRNFTERHGADEVVLSQSYRVPRLVHGVAERIAARIRPRVPKQYAPRPAEGGVTEAPDFNIDYVDEDRDSLLLCCDKFVRRDVLEYELQDAALPYTCLGGYPAPMDTKAGRAMRAVHSGKPLTAEDLKTVKRGLNKYGQMLWDEKHSKVVIERMRKGDLSALQMPRGADEYFARVAWDGPITIRVGTIHSAKGMEAEHVHLVTGQSDAAVQHAFVDANAAHRLFYVGVTRASDQLHIYDGDNGYEVPV